MARIPPEERRWWVLAAVAVALGLAVATWFGISATRGVTWTDAGHHVVDDQNIQVRFEVVDRERAPVRCTVSALSSSHAVVGRRSGQFPASSSASTLHVLTVRTTERAVAGTVDTCSRVG